MDVSVLIVTRNTCDLTCAAVASVMESRGPYAKEVIVIDNGSTDETAARLRERFPSIAYQNLGGNLGFARANNLAARQASGEFLLLLNSDARLQPSSLGLARDWMRRQPEAGVVGAQLLNPDGSFQNSIANYPTLATELINKSLLRRLSPRRFPGKEQKYAAPVEVESVIGAFLLTRKSTWDKLGGLDEDYFFFIEETDYCWRAQRLGQKVYHLPQVLVWHGQGQTAQQERIAARIEYWRSRYLFFRKNHSLASRFILRAGLFLRLMIDWAGNGLLTFLTRGTVRRIKQKHHVNQALLEWHLKGCPSTMGLPR